METNKGRYIDAVGSENLNNQSYTLKTIFDLTGSAIQKGISYSFRYRVFNVNGWSDFSDVSIVEAADAPSQPAPLTIFSQTSKQITLEFNLGTVDNNGS